MRSKVSAKMMRGSTNKGATIDVQFQTSITIQTLLLLWESSFQPAYKEIPSSQNASASVNSIFPSGLETCAPLGLNN
jgi:hypothetical protein